MHRSFVFFTSSRNAAPPGNSANASDRLSRPRCMHRISAWLFWGCSMDSRIREYSRSYRAVGIIHSSMIIACADSGPCTPKVSFSSMSPVRLGPERKLMTQFAGLSLNIARMRGAASS